MRTGIDTGEFRRGWPPLLAALLGNATGVGAIVYYSMSSFTLPLEREFGWSRSDMGFAVSCPVFGWIVSMPLVGMLRDRPRGPVLFGGPFHVGAVLAPVLVGELHAFAGDYSPVLQASIASCILASVLVLALGPYPEIPRTLSMREDPAR